ncbi:MAG TPA: XrtA/PEP-CTERM system histidine kinase PrsK [Allosphingosinicella sp.]
MIGSFGLWAQIAAAFLYGALALWHLSRQAEDKRSHPLTAAFAVTSAWMAFLVARGPYDLLPGIAEPARNICFLAFMYGLATTAGDERQDALKTVYGAVAAAVGLQFVTACMLFQVEAQSPAFQAIEAGHQVLGLTVSAGALILVHNLYGQADAGSRHTIRLPMLALAAMWAYDLHLYTVAYLMRGLPDDLLALRGAMLVLLVPFFAATGRKGSPWTVQLSRAATFQSLSMLAIFAYLIVMMSATRALEAVDARWVDTAQVAILVLMTASLLILLPSRQARAWLRVKAAKHFFPHRYDYRTEWLRFTRTLGTGEGQDLPLDTRIVKALAQIAESPAGLMLAVRNDERFVPAAGWNWLQPEPSPWTDAVLCRFLADRAHVIDFGSVKEGILAFDGCSMRLPDWLSGSGLWAGIPLLHNERLIALVLLAPPPVPRRIDWEDIDLFRAAGGEAASYLAEARAQEELADSRKFDEFSRRFAFIMHDIKNLVSQISLVARNAERHADNPEFRADMIATLQGSVRKMNDLLARLSHGAQGEARPPVAIELRAALAPLIETRARLHPILLDGTSRVMALADQTALEQALVHLLQNAVEASPAGAPVRVTLRDEGDRALIEIVDSGCGMSRDFIRTRLFQPFASTKEAGFGIGAYEARALVEAMGGRLEVESREGEGTTFTIILPAAPLPATSLKERIRAS